MILAGVFEGFIFKETSKQTDLTMVGLTPQEFCTHAILDRVAWVRWEGKCPREFVSVAVAFCLFCFPLASSQLTKFSLSLSEEGYHIL